MRSNVVMLGWMLLLRMPQMPTSSAKNTPGLMPDKRADSLEWSLWSTGTCDVTGKERRSRIQVQERTCSECSTCPHGYAAWGNDFCYKAINCWETQDIHNITSKEDIPPDMTKDEFLLLLDKHDRETRCISYVCRAGRWWCTHYCCDEIICIIAIGNN